MIYIILSVIISVLGLCYFLFKDLNFFEKHGIPHVKPLLFLGNIGTTLFRRKTYPELIKSMYNLHPDAKYVGVYDMTATVIVIRDPELIKAVTLKHFDTFMDHRFIPVNVDPFFDRTLTVLRGEKWQEARSILSPAFTSSKMKNMFKLMSDYGIEFSNYLAQLPPEKRMMEMKDVFSRYTNDVIATCAFGISVNSMRDPNNEFYVYGKEMMTFSPILFLKFNIIKTLPWLSRIFKMRFLREELTDYFRNLIKTTIKTREEKGITRPDMLQLMMESRGTDGKRNLTVDDMVSHAFTFFFGGFDSSSLLMSFAAHEIAANQDVQERLQNEIDQVLEDNDGQAPYEAINNMEYLDAVISETLRMYPNGLVMDRLCLKDFELPPTLPGIEPLPIKKGQGIWIPIYGLHHDPKYFEKPEKFDPERFLGERKRSSLNCGAYLPFGLGPRMCIGNRFALLETKILLFHLLARCELQVCKKTSLPIEIGNTGFILSSKKGFWLSVVPRKNMHHTIAVNGTYSV